ncbi:hypothetical protein GRI43_01030 [Altererythrobacter luteolus]|uniref:Uncharacterized protein n=1 Tax=Pontixanthobacter luteolus TaxID=295089 RepID=A0A6I4UWM7_9SPHN|nr:hypothetical protein [Pontixanthobacter luteolus]MXP45975.1 hypothetical protein [Pontixanthobacter luteolus]
MTLSLKTLAPTAAMALAIGVAAPAYAAPANGWSQHQQTTYSDARSYRGYDRQGYDRQRYNRKANRIDRRIDTLRQDFRQARRSGELTRAETRSVRARIHSVERAYAAFARNGLSRQDRSALNWRIEQAYDALNRAQYNRSARYDQRRSYRSRY